MRKSLFTYTNLSIHFTIILQWLSALSRSYFHKQLSVLFFRKCFKQPLFTILISFDHTISFKLHKLNSNNIKEEFNWVIIKNIKKSIILGKTYYKSITTMIRSIMIATSIMIMIKTLWLRQKYDDHDKKYYDDHDYHYEKSIMMTMIIIMILSNHIKTSLNLLNVYLFPGDIPGLFYDIYRRTQIFLCSWLL